METEDLIVNKGCEGKVVEEVGEVFPNVCVAVLSKTFIVETVDLGDLSGFMISSKDGDSGWISDLESDKKCDCFH